MEYKSPFHPATRILRKRYLCHHCCSFSPMLAKFSLATTRLHAYDLQDGPYTSYFSRNEPAALATPNRPFVHDGRRNAHGFCHVGCAIE